ncbi:NAD-dependent epimerase/dehydratase family protein [Streptomyces sp. NPDC059255]|uniref:NAD-dependent epimerase/dehydratase family protein n=1 Tax=Streptomyces sp. NPDC059255 TaxID=3346793 RepID=UPI003685303B
MPASPVLHLSMLPEYFTDVDHLEDFMSTPTAETVADLQALDGDIAILGVAGKMGITLARLIKRAVPHKRVLGVARFSDPAARERLERWGVETISCDLLDRESVLALPRFPNVIYMAGLKFDAAGREDFLWAMNTLAPAHVAEAFADSRIVALSTIHVYPWSNPLHGGVTEATPPLARPGEYANSVVGRERTFQYFSRLHGTPGRLVRFAYAIDMRYGVLQEISRWVLDGVEIPLETGAVNIMWQGDAINQFARLLQHCEAPSSPINIGNPELTSVRRIATAFGEIFGIEPRFTGTETDCLAVNCDRAAELLGNPVIPLNTMIKWVAEWSKADKPLHGKPSKFEVRTGRF